MMGKRWNKPAIALSLALLLAAMMAAATPALAAGGNTGGLTWEFNASSGVLTISGSGAMPAYAFYEHEDKYDDPSHYITPWYSYRNSVIKVVIGEGVTKVSANAFTDCRNLALLTLPSTLDEIGSGAFSTTKLTTVSLPASLTVIGSYAFYNTGLTEIQLPAGIRQVGAGAFAETRITDVNLNCVGSAFGEDVFDGAPVTSVTLGPNMTEVPAGMFRNTPLASIDLPDTVAAIGANAFASTKLTEIDLPAGVVSIGAGAFQNAPLTRVGLPEALREIGANAFSGTRLSEIDLPSGLTVIGAGVFQNAPLTRVGLPEALQEIGSSAFAGTRLEALELPAGVVSIGASAFKGSSLGSIALSESLLSIGASAFQNTSLSEIDLPDGILLLGSKAFMGTGIASAVIPASVTSMPWDTFPADTALTFRTPQSGVTGDLQWYCMDGTLTILGSGPMPDYSYHKSTSIYDSNYPLTPWRQCGGIRSVVLADGITSVGNYAFADLRALNQVRLPASLTAIGAYAFERCQYLQQISLPEGLVSIGNSAFFNGNLTSLTLPSTLREIGVDAFHYNSFTSVTIPTGVAEIPARAFYACYELTEISIPETVTHFGADAFAFCENLKKVQYRDDNENSPGETWAYHTYDNRYATPTCYGAELRAKWGTSIYVSLQRDDPDIGDYAFYNCSSTIRVVVGAGGDWAWPGKVGNYAFYGCSKLESMDATTGVGPIGNYAFYGCTSLKNIYHLLDSPDIGDYAFYGCTSLPGTLEIRAFRIGDSAFEGCTSVKTVTLQKTVDAIGDRAFNGCSALKLVEFKGKAPAFEADAYREQFKGVTASVFYRLHDSWNTASMLNYGGALTWKPVGDGVLSADGVMRYSGSGGASISIYYDRIYYRTDVYIDSAYSPEVIYVDTEDVHKLVFDEGVTVLSGDFSGLTSVDEILFLGDAPRIQQDIFGALGATVYWVESREGWTDEARAAFGSALDWRGVCGGSADFAGISAYGHALAEVEAVSPTCTEGGNAAHWRCDVCGLAFQDGESGVRLTEEQVALPATGHSFGAPVYAWAEDHAGCEASFGCESCGLSVALAMTLPDAPETLKQASCAEEGLVRYTASLTIDGPVFMDDAVYELPAGVYACEEAVAVEKLPHTLVTIPGFPATCTEPGLTDDISCEVCGETLQEARELEPTGHVDAVTIEAAEPTCEQPGRTAEHRCGVCGDLLQASEAIPALGHAYGEPSVAWSEDGAACAMTFTCGRCGGAVEVAATVTASVKREPGCIEPGVTEYAARLVFDETEYARTCERTDIPAKGHVPVEDPAVAPTDREGGLTAGSHCAVCGVELVAQQPVPALWSTVTGEDGSVTATAYNGDAVELTIPDFITALGDALFKNDDSVTCVHVPDTVTAVGKQTFYGMSAARDIYLPGDLVGIASQTFYNNGAALHADVESHTARVLSYRGKSFTDGPWTLHYRATNPDNQPASVYLIAWDGEGEALALPESFGGAALIKIESGAFAGRTQLRELTVPACVTDIAADAFTGLEEALTIRSAYGAAARIWALDNGFAWVHDAHAPAEDARVEPDCEHDGLTAGSHCAQCGEVLVPQEPIPALGHDWGDAAYEWVDDYAGVTATRVCKRDGDHVESETTQNVSAIAVPATCDAAGETTYTAEFESEAFEARQLTVVDPPALGHDWGDAAYEWADDYAGVTATRACKRDGTHVETETAATTFRLAAAPTEDRRGATVYTASFENPCLPTAEATVEDIPALKELAVLALPARLEAIGDEAFTGLACEAVIIPDGCASIGSRAFANCENLIYVRIPASVTHIAGDAFEGCDRLRIDRAE